MSLATEGRIRKQLRYVKRNNNVMHSYLRRGRIKIIKKEAKPQHSLIPISVTVIYQHLVTF